MVCEGSAVDDLECDYKEKLETNRKWHVAEGGSEINVNTVF